MQKIDLIFTRDFSLFTCEFWRERLLLDAVAKAWGASITDQIIRFNGRLIEAYRIREDVEKVKEHVIHLPFDYQLFSDEFRNDFKKAVAELRELIEKIESDALMDTAEVWPEALRLFRAMYPAYMLAVFLPGPWADDLRKVKGAAAEPILKTLYDNRLFMEGLFEETDLALRHMVRQKLELHGMDGTLAHLVNFSEAEALLTKNLPPQKTELEKRKLGYIIIKGEMIIGRDLKEVLQENSLEYDFPDVEGIKEFKGSPAYPSEPVTAPVHLLYTVDDIKNFPADHILVMAMTSPDFLPAIKKAKAIVTDEGGITCHAAIVSREMKIPCVIGTKIATKVLKDGMEVEVDATKGVVRILK